MDGEHHSVSEPLDLHVPGTCYKVNAGAADVHVHTQADLQSPLQGQEDDKEPLAPRSNCSMLNTVVGKGSKLVAIATE